MRFTGEGLLFLEIDDRWHGPPPVRVSFDHLGAMRMTEGGRLLVRPVGNFEFVTADQQYCSTEVLRRQAILLREIILCRRPSRPRPPGSDAAVVDHAPMDVPALAAGDNRRYTANVAGPAALLVAKLHKLGERQENPRRLLDKDAHDVYRLLVAVPTQELAATLARLADDQLAGPVTEQALVYLREMFASGAQASGSTMAGRAEEGVSEPDTVAAAVVNRPGNLRETRTPGRGLPRAARTVGTSAMRQLLHPGRGRGTSTASWS